MSFDGNGNYSLPGVAPWTTGTTISSTNMNTVQADIATALTNCVTRDGQSPATQNLPLGGKKITNLGDATLSTDAANIKTAQNGAFAWCSTAGGTANAITLSPSPAITAYAAGQKFVFIAANTNGGATTVAISGLSAIAIQWNQAACAGGEIVAGTIYELYLNSTTAAQVRPFNPGLSNTAIFGGPGTATASRAVVLDASKNIGTLGTVTATSFVGPLTGNVTGNVTGSSGSCTGNAATATIAGSITSQGALATLNTVTISQLDPSLQHNWVLIASGSVSGPTFSANLDTYDETKLVIKDAHCTTGSGVFSFYFGHGSGVNPAWVVTKYSTGTIATASDGTKAYLAAIANQYHNIEMIIRNYGGKTTSSAQPSIDYTVSSYASGALGEMVSGHAAAAAALNNTINWISFYEGGTNSLASGTYYIYGRNL